MAFTNVEYVTTVPVDGGGAQVARVHGDYLYLASWRGWSIYDVSDPLAPALVSTTPAGFTFPNESLDTNGDVVILKEEIPVERLLVYDVTDKANPALIAGLPNVPDHTIECLFDCKWAYGSDGTIYDLREPAQPKVAGSWDDGSLVYGHTVAEVAPGLALTTSLPTLRLLDARKDPTKPRQLAMAASPSSLTQGVSRWPGGGRDRFLLSAEESSFTARCDAESSVFRTYDASKWKRTHSFTVVDELRMDNGTVQDGRAPAGVLGCSTHGFAEHPAFKDGGIVALAHYENGLRFLEIDGRGKIAEVGYFLPYGGETSGTLWMTDEIVYTFDVVRGIDILRFTGE